MNQNDIMTSLSYFLFQHFYADRNNVQSQMRGKQPSQSSTGRRMDSEKRPFFRIENAKHQTQQMGAKGFIDQHIWNIWYYGDNELISRWTADRITEIVNTDRKIQGYLLNHQFQKPTIVGIEHDDGQLYDGIGYIYVSVVAKAGDSESLGTIASEPVRIYPENNETAIRIYLPKEPTMKTNFDWYDIYAGIDSDTLTLQNESPIRHYNGKYIEKYENMVIDLLDVYDRGLGVLPNNEHERADVSVNALTPFYKIYVMESRVEHLQHEKDSTLWDTKIQLITYSRGSVLPTSPAPPIKNYAVRGFVNDDIFMNTDKEEDGSIILYADRAVTMPILPGVAI